MILFFTESVLEFIMVSPLSLVHQQQVSSQTLR